MPWRLRVLLAGLREADLHAAHAAAIAQIADLSKSLEELDHIELFKIIQALLVLKTMVDIPDRSRALFAALATLLSGWMSEAKPKRAETEQHHFHGCIPCARCGRHHPRATEPCTPA